MNYKDMLKFVNEKNEFMKYNGIKVNLIENDYAEVILEATSNSLNPYGLLHGGVYYTMADCAAGAAARSNGGKYVTLNSSFNYIKSAKNGNIKAIAKIIHRGKTTCVVGAEVRNSEGILLSEGNFTMFCLKSPEQN